ncbi:MAG: hypothetical protein R2849_09670 [Thermomicrobiales bacterium]
MNGNTADHDGGGIFNNGSLTLTNSTLAGNGANLGSGGGIFNYLVTANLQATIIAGSPAGGNCGGNIISLGENLSDDGSCNLIAAGDLPNTDPLLGPLQNNGGRPRPSCRSPAAPPSTPRLPARPAAINAASAARRAHPRHWRGRAPPEPDLHSLRQLLTGAVTSPLYGNCGTGQIEIEVSNSPSFASVPGPASCSTCLDGPVIRHVSSTPCPTTAIS